jgi:pSer/pThr/pTyr-binding forkhead associated (FHA) protein
VSDQATGNTSEADDTVLRPVAHRPATAKRREHPDGDTIIRLVAPGAPSSASTGGSISTARSPAPGAVAPTIRWSLRVRGTPTIVSLDVPAIIGRRPGTPHPTEQPMARRVVISAEYGDVSGRHVHIEQIGETLVVSDLGSTNGVLIYAAPASETASMPEMARVVRLRPGESCAVLPDAVVRIGDSVAIEFVRSAPTAPSPLTPQFLEPS